MSVEKKEKGDIWYRTTGILVNIRLFSAKYITSSRSKSSKCRWPWLGHLNRTTNASTYGYYGYYFPFLQTVRPYQSGQDRDHLPTCSTLSIHSFSSMNSYSDWVISSTQFGKKNCIGKIFTSKSICLFYSIFNLFLIVKFLADLPNQPNDTK